MCSGVMIKENLVLTSASCAEAVGPNPTLVINAIDFYDDGSSNFKGQVPHAQRKIVV